MNKTTESHPLLSMAHKIDERGLMVFDVHTMPTGSESFTTPYMVLVLNMQGYVRAECDMRPVCFQPRDIAVLPPRHVIRAQEVSADYHAMMIVMSVAFQEDRKQDSTDAYRDNFHYLTRPHVKLDEEQFEVISRLFWMVQTISFMDYATRDEMLTHQLNTIFLLLQEYRRENGVDEHEPTGKEQLFTQFYQAITQHYMQSREVKYYAEMFHMAPKYFSTVIRQHTKTKALDWINGYVMVQAKVMLRYEQMTVQEVALKLGFVDQAAFSRFFKTNSGMTPTEYKEQA